MVANGNSHWRLGLNEDRLPFSARTHDVDLVPQRSHEGPFEPTVAESSWSLDGAVDANMAIWIAE